MANFALHIMGLEIDNAEPSPELPKATMLGKMEKKPDFGCALFRSCLYPSRGILGRIQRPIADAALVLQVSKASLQWRAPHIFSTQLVHPITVVSLYFFMREREHTNTSFIL